jgi:Uma2 family endonuclease
MSTLQVVLNDPETQAPLRLRPNRRMNDDEYFEFCAANSGLRIERTAAGEILIMAPTGGETGHRNTELVAQLHLWAKRDGHGKAFDSNTEFILPDSSALSPDASWIENSRLQTLSRDQKRKFMPLCPDFIVELTSPTDRLSRVRDKMKQWVANGAQLGWLIDADKRTVYVYRPNRDPEQLTGIEVVHGEGPVAGFVLELADIFAEL